MATPLTIEEMKANASKASNLLKSMSNSSRLLILCILGEQEMSVGALNAELALSQSSLSQHLAKLRQEGLVSTRRDSQTIYYSIANPIVMKLISTLYEEYCQ